MKATAEAFIAVVFLYLFYVVCVECVAAFVEHRSGPRRRARARVPPPSLHGDNRGMGTDVSSLVPQYRRLSRMGFVAQFLVSPLLAAGLIADLTGGASLPGSLLVLLLLASAAVARHSRVQAAKLGFTTARWRDAYVRLFTGKRPIAVALLLVLVAILLIISTWLLSNASIGVGGDTPNWWIVLATLGGLSLSAVPYQAARRLALLDAREVTKSDDRPVVLYLRSFADDDLAMRAHMSASNSLLEVLWPRRFDRFEDIIAKILSRIGPVVAVGRRGKFLAPAGAARDVLHDSEWRQGVERWMKDAQLLVVVLGRSVGLAWELEQLSELQLWSETLLIFPPVDDAELAHRWGVTRAVIEETSGSTPVLRGRLSEIAVVRLQADGQPLTYTVDRRDDRSYEIALGAALPDLGGRRSAGRH